MAGLAAPPLTPHGLVADRHGPSMVPGSWTSAPCGLGCVMCMSSQPTQDWVAEGEGLGAELPRQLAGAPAAAGGRPAAPAAVGGAEAAALGRRAALPQEERCYLLEYIGLLEEQRRRLYENLACALAQLEEERRRQEESLDVHRVTDIMQVAGGREALHAQLELEQRLVAHEAELEAERRLQAQEVGALRARMQDECSERDHRISILDAERGRQMAHLSEVEAEWRSQMAKAAELEAQKRRLCAQEEDLALERRSFALQVNELEAKRRQWAARGAELDAAERVHAQHAAWVDAAKKQHAELALRLQASETETETQGAELYAAERRCLVAETELEAARQQHAGQVAKELEELDIARKHHAREFEDLATQRRLQAQELEVLEAQRGSHAKSLDDLECERRRQTTLVFEELEELKAEKRRHDAQVLSDCARIKHQLAELRTEKLSSIVCQWRHCATQEKEVAVATDWSKQTFVDITEEHGEVNIRETPPRALEIALQNYFGRTAGDDRFAELSHQQMKSMFASLTPCTYHEGDTVIRQGDVGNELFLIESGSLQVIVNGQYSTTLKTCDAFGDHALVNDEPRAATVKVVSTTAKLWSMNREEFEKHSQLKLAACVDSLIQRGLPVFRNLSKAHAESIMSAAKLRTYRADEVVTQQGDDGDAFFVIERGQLQLIKDGNRLRLLQSGECFGELALLNSEKRAATVQVVTDAAELWMIGRDDFLRHSHHMLKASVDALLESPSFQSVSQHWSRDDLNKLMCRSKLHVYHRGQDVVHQGEEGLSFFTIENGTLNILINGKDAGVMERGECFGETALVSGGKRAATVRVASGVAELWVISREDFLALAPVEGMS